MSPMKQKKTFVIEIIDQQHATWQGTVEWIDGQKKESFRSALELLTLIGSAVDKKEK